ncbi:MULTISPECIES: hypothetical protein [unclassified Bradyrhizobium]|uniref:hypothetical protein n=1 Tax=unclassified Bradyrhizobium TaxID=2631580 RepID=UPI0028EAD223|nr:MULTISPECIES: hypothetical protein [unclassified Bradyrhizobium]
MDLLPFLGTLGLGALGGAVAGSIITQVMTNARDRRAQRVAFVKQQLEQFYGPLLAARREIKARSELRVRLQEALIEPPAVGDIDAHVRAMDANVDDENQTFREVMMPRYREMISIFRDKMWLAEPATREFFGELIEFVDVWDKILNKKLPNWIASRINHTEANLHPLYAHLEETHDRLRREVS